MGEQLTLYKLDAVKNDRGPNRGVRMEMLKEFLLDHLPNSTCNAKIFPTQKIKK
jgi:hypothetical protein